MHRNCNNFSQWAWACVVWDTKVLWVFSSNLHCKSERTLINGLNIIKWICQIWKLFKWNIQFSPFKVWLDPVIPELEVVTSEVIFPVPNFSSPKEIVKLFLHQHIAIGHAFRSMFPKVSKVKMIIQCEHLKIFIPKLNGGSVKLSLCTFWEMWHVEAMSVPHALTFLGRHKIASIYDKFTVSFFLKSSLEEQCNIMKLTFWNNKLALSLNILCPLIGFPKWVYLRCILFFNLRNSII